MGFSRSLFGKAPMLRTLRWMLRLRLRLRLKGSDLVSHHVAIPPQVQGIRELADRYGGTPGVIPQNVSTYPKLKPGEPNGAGGK